MKACDTLNCTKPAITGNPEVLYSRYYCKSCWNIKRKEVKNGKEYTVSTRNRKNNQKSVD